MFNANELILKVFLHYLVTTHIPTQKHFVNETILNKHLE